MNGNSILIPGDVHKPTTYDSVLRTKSPESFRPIMTSSSPGLGSQQRTVTRGTRVLETEDPLYDIVLAPAQRRHLMRF